MRVVWFLLVFFDAQNHRKRHFLHRYCSVTTGYLLVPGTLTLTLTLKLTLRVSVVVVVRKDQNVVITNTLNYSAAEL